MKLFSLDALKVWVLAPYLRTYDANNGYYYEYSQNIEEYTKAFAELGVKWVWQPVTMDTYASIISTINKEKEAAIDCPIVLNLCDGDEINGTPGISVIKLLQHYHLSYSGADEYFYQITTSKIPMKFAFDKANVPNAKWEVINSKLQDTKGIFERLGHPIIVKPAVGAGSLGLSVKNVVKSEAKLNALILKMFEGFRGWNLVIDGLIAEQFIAGPEFTVFISGSYTHPSEMKIYTPVERVFHASLAAEERFISFDRYWETYEDEEAMPNGEIFFKYALPHENLIEKIKQISRDAYIACKGMGYGRVDVRQDAATQKLYVLEVNAQCGLSADEASSSLGAILRYNNKKFHHILSEILEDAMRRKLPSLIE